MLLDYRPSKNETYDRAIRDYSGVRFVPRRGLPLHPAVRNRRSVRFFFGISLIVVFFISVFNVRGATNRSAYIPYDYSWYAAPDFKYVALDQIHQQIFLAWRALDRIDVLSTLDYHTIQSIAVPSPSSLDISPDGTTLAVGTSSAHILFFDTGTFVKTNDVVFHDSALGITAFVYAGNGNAFVRAAEGLSTGGGITAYWDHVTNSFSNQSNAEGAIGPYRTTGPLARSGDYSRIVLGDASSGGGVKSLTEIQARFFSNWALGATFSVSLPTKMPADMRSALNPQASGAF